MTYFDLLKLLLPHGAYSGSDSSEHGKDISVHAGGMGACQVNADALFVEIFPNATDALLEDWERVYGLSQSDRPRFQRLQNLLAVINARGGLSVQHIQAALRPFIGIDAGVEEYMAFRCDDPRCVTDHSRYALEEDYIYQFRVFVDNALLKTVGYNAAAVQKVIDRIKPAHTTGILDTGNYGFFTDDPGSLTDLTLLGDGSPGFFCDDPKSLTDFTFLAL